MRSPASWSELKPGNVMWAWDNMTKRPDVYFGVHASVDNVPGIYPVRLSTMYCYLGFSCAKNTLVSNDLCLFEDFDEFLRESPHFEWNREEGST